MQVFKIKQNGFKEIRKKILLRSFFTLLIAGVGIIITINSNEINFEQKENDVNNLPIFIPLLIAIFGFGIYRGLNRQKNLFESYTLTIANNLMIREQLDTPTISIYFNDIEEIIKYKNGSFKIKGKVAVDLIGIPVQINNYSQLETALQQIQPIVEKVKVSFIEEYPSFIGVVTGGLMVCVCTINNKIIVASTGSAFIALMVWSLIETRSSKNIDSKTRKIFWIAFAVLVSIITVMVYKLTRTINV
jgi:hypothetical protein